MKLLTRNNMKTEKGEEQGWVTYILNLAPGNLSGHEVCPRRTKECFKHCLNTAGNGRFPNVQKARIERTKLFFEDRDTFLLQLVGEIAQASYTGDKVCIRLNGTSDIKWEKFKIIERFPQIQFYDYTKIPPMDRVVPDNYDLTYSWSGYNKLRCVNHLDWGGNVAVPYTGPMPTEWHGYPTCDGDINDLRFLDPLNHVVMLKAKGSLRGKTNKFVFNYEELT